MPTQKPLRDLLPRIMEHISNHVEYMVYNNRLFLVHEGQLRKEIEDSLRKELSDKAYAKAIQRVPSINVLQRIIEKLSRVYSQPVERRAASALDKELIAYYEDEAKINKRMTAANKIFNLSKACALEPFIDDGCPNLRVLPAHEFLVFSDNPVNPLRPTVFIKFMGTDRSVPYTDRNGRLTIVDEVREVQKYYLYSDAEFLIVDSEGAIRNDRMAETQQDGTNPVGVIPFVYLNRSEHRLIPVPDTDTLENTILIPKLLADLNYAVQFQSHSIFVGVDLDLPSDMAISPDVVWNMKSADETKQGRMDTIHPTVDIERVLMLIKATLTIWLETRNIKAGDMGQSAPGDAASGVARIIDEADATQDRQAQIVHFSDAEQDLWDLIAVMHNYWVDSGQMLENTDKFSDDPDIAVIFGDQKPVVTDREKIDTVILKREAALITREQAVRELYPQLSDDEVEGWIEDLKAEEAADKALNEPLTGQPISTNPEAPQGPQDAAASGGTATPIIAGASTKSGPRS